jgi:hypothetical protein
MSCRGTGGKEVELGAGGSPGCALALPMGPAALARDSY